MGTSDIKSTDTVAELPGRTIPLAGKIMNAPRVNRIFVFPVITFEVPAAPGSLEIIEIY